MAFLVPLFFIPIFSDYGAPKVTLAEMLTISLGILWLVSMVRDGEILVVDTTIYYTFLALLSIQFVSLLQANNVYQGLDTLFQNLCYFLIVILVFHTFLKLQQVHLIAGTMALTGSLVALVGLFQHLGIYGFYSPWSLPVSTIGNVNFVAEYYNVVFPISLAAIFVFRNIWVRAGLSVACVLMGYHLVILRSRGGWLGMVLGLVILGGIALLRHFRVGRRLLDGFLALVVVVGLSWPVVTEMVSGIQLGPDRDLGRVMTSTWQSMTRRLEDAMRLRDDSTRQRVNLWEDSVRLVFDRPLLGVGVGNYAFQIPRYMGRESLEIKQRMEQRLGREMMAFRAHNEYLEVWAETGIVGVIIFGVLLYQLVGAVYGLLKRYLQGEGDFLIAGLAAAVGATLFHSFFSSNLQDPASAVHFWMVAGLIWSLKLNADGRTPLELLATTARKVALGVIAVGGVALVGTVVLGGYALLGEYHFRQGEVWFRRAAYDRAEAEFETAVQYRPARRFSAYQELGKTQYNQHKWPDAILAFRQSLVHHPNSASTHYYLGRALAKSGNPKAGTTHLQRAIDLNPVDDRFHLGLGEGLGLSGNYEQALIAIQEAIRLNPTHAKAYHMLGGQYKQTGDMDRAVAAYQKALDLEPGDTSVLNSLAVVYANQKQFEQARQILENLAKERPDEPDYQVNLGNILLMEGNPKAALAICLKVLEAHPNHTQAYAIIGLAFEAVGQRERAVLAYREALQRDPGNRKIQNLLQALTAQDR